MPIRRLAPPLAAALLATIPGLALAHAELVTAEPSSGASLAEPPAEIVLTFEGELDPDASGFTVTDAAGDSVGSGQVDLQVADRNVMRGDVAISDDGVYTVEWTAVAGDGHPESGTYSFRVDPAYEEDGVSPDTALRRPAPLLPAGLALLALALLQALRVLRAEVGR